MSDKRKTREHDTLTQSGKMPAVSVETAPKREAPPRPTTVPEQVFDTSATTGIMPAVGESEDKSAARDEDRASGK